MAGHNSILGLAAGILFFALPAKADLTISSKPTQNVSCSAGVCTATDKKAVLNVDELTAMLGSGDVTVSTGGVAKDIEVSAGLSWAGTSRLTLEADKSLVVKQPVTVAGSGALTLSSNGGHQSVDLEFFGKGNIQFWDLSSNLVINGKSYTLVGDIATLAADIAANPSGSYALAKPYDASVDGTYSSSPIPTTFEGTFEGLGNAISNLAFSLTQSGAGLFSFIDDGAEVRNLVLQGEVFNSDGSGGGGLAAGNAGLIDRCHVAVVIRASNGSSVQLGGFVASNSGTIANSHAKVSIDDEILISNVGGIAGENRGTIVTSYVEGAVRAGDDIVRVGALVGLNEGIVENAYAVSTVRERHRCCRGGSFGGLIGENASTGTVVASYAAGNIEAKASDIDLGGLIGTDDASLGGIENTYWDIDRGVSDPSQGAGNVPNDPGITGLTTIQFQAALPAGFDPKVWAEDSRVNDGLPYLLGVP
jgi:hypothetical protein